MREKIIGIMLATCILLGLTFTVCASENNVEETINTETEEMLEIDIENEIEKDGKIDREEVDTENNAEEEIESEAESKEEVEIKTGTKSEAGVKMETDTEGKAEIDTESKSEVEIETEEEDHLESKKIYSVVFPSIKHFRFTIDPYGLKVLEDGQKASLDELSHYGGRIYCDSEMMVTNNGSIPIKVTVSLQVTGDANVVENLDEVEADNENNILMCIVPSSNDLKGRSEQYYPSDIGIAVKKDESTVVEFLLPAKEQLDVNNDEGRHSTAFKITGCVNRNGDWNTFNHDGKKVGMQIFYSYEDASDIVAVYEESSEAFGLLSYNSTEIDISELKRN